MLAFYSDEVYNKKYLKEYAVFTKWTPFVKERKHEKETSGSAADSMLGHGGRCGVREQLVEEFIVVVRYEKWQQDLRHRGRWYLPADGL